MEELNKKEGIYKINTISQRSGLTNRFVKRIVEKYFIDDIQEFGTTYKIPKHVGDRIINFGALVQERMEQEGISSRWKSAFQELQKELIHKHFANSSGGSDPNGEIVIDEM